MQITDFKSNLINSCLAIVSFKKTSFKFHSALTSAIEIRLDSKTSNNSQFFSITFIPTLTDSNKLKELLTPRVLS